MTDAPHRSAIWIQVLLLIVMAPAVAEIGRVFGTQSWQFLLFLPLYASLLLLAIELHRLNKQGKRKGRRLQIESICVVLGAVAYAFFVLR